MDATHRQLILAAAIAGAFAVVNTVVLSIFGYIQWRGSQRAAALEDQEEDDRQLMVVFQQQLHTAFQRIDAQDTLIGELRNEIHTLKLELTDTVIENKELKWRLKGQVT